MGIQFTPFPISIEDEVSWSLHSFSTGKSKHFCDPVVSLFFLPVSISNFILTLLRNSKPMSPLPYTTGACDPWRPSRDALLVPEATHTALSERRKVVHTFSLSVSVPLSVSFSPPWIRAGCMQVCPPSPPCLAIKLNTSILSLALNAVTGKWQVSAESVLVITLLWNSWEAEDCPGTCLTRHWSVLPGDSPWPMQSAILEALFLQPVVTGDTPGASGRVCTDPQVLLWWRKINEHQVGGSLEQLLWLLVECRRLIPVFNR